MYRGDGVRHADHLVGIVVGRQSFVEDRLEGTDPAGSPWLASFWILLGSKADLSAAPSIKDWGARGTFVMNQLKNEANRTQRGLRIYLHQHGIAYKPYWIANVILVYGRPRR